MSTTPSLGLPLIAAAQAQKHVTHNEAIHALDALLYLDVLDRDRASPPDAPSAGDRYLVAVSSTGAWSGRAGALAAWLDGAWRFFAPRAGWIARIADEGVVLAYDGSAWVDLVAAGGISTLQNLSRLGVGTTADATNPLAAKLNNALLTARTAGEGGDGDLRVKLNKESAADTLSLLFQSGFAGRAEIGLAGDDDLVVKVSADGATWTEALRVARASGAVSAPNLLRVDAAQSFDAAQRGRARDNIAAGPELGYGLAFALAGNALTASLKRADGADPSAAAPVILRFRPASGASGAPATRTLGGPLSLVLPSGATLGRANGVMGPLYWYALDHAGAIELAVVGSFAFGNAGVASAVAISSSSNAAATMYAANARAGAAYRLLGRSADTQTTAGLWAAAPSHVQTVEHVPPVEQVEAVEYTANADITATIPFDDTRPQATEGTQVLAAGFTPRWPTNAVLIDVCGFGGQNGGFGLVTALFSDQSADAIQATWANNASGGYRFPIVAKAEHRPLAAGPRTYSVRCGPGAGGAAARINGTNNGGTGMRDFGGASRLVLTLMEVPR